ncbi:metalloregulator ArsR/SmtB family transcription factor [Anaerolentibacter hominis]|uniref:ArsR/SmtB family transcription factor n=1 Tax=Anaerolentibacter hominis TaxID=3079009 RepID=UPI0031B7FD12
MIPHDHGQNLEELIDIMPGEDSFIAASDLFTQLCDSTRLRILWLLCHCEECVADISAAVGMSAPAVSHHLRILRQTGFVVNRRVGKEVHYTLANTPEARLLHKMIDAVFEMQCPGMVHPKQQKQEL